MQEKKKQLCQLHFVILDPLVQQVSPVNPPLQYVKDTVIKWIWKIKQIWKRELFWQRIQWTNMKFYKDEQKNKQKWWCLVNLNPHIKKHRKRCSHYNQEHISWQSLLLHSFLFLIQMLTQMKDPSLVAKIMPLLQHYHRLELHITRCQESAIVRISGRLAKLN